ncbi:probable N-acetyltransferase camello [Pelobates cultripes]|uniref:Probable N-acetyltransferase camello n=1 Tax=Pelobates cultripes TaxID=61616 RepID=A0AAD1SFY9_PELCU|nr:probable N-acetyltransferase camello [Pelobates cultripes]CAH2299155.1 probable N-acetyltransferase camello [Pelobates cultripes]
MANVSFRRYKNTDYDAVRLLFEQGMKSHIPSICVHILKLPRAQTILVLAFIIVFTISKSYLLSLMGVTTVLAAGWLLVNTNFNSYVEKCHKDDLLDIEKSYMENKKSCFWVAESNGRVIGMVGVQPTGDTGDIMVLRRLSVAKDQRGQGIAKSLCKIVLDFARKHGAKYVNLDTSIIQRPAHKLYEYLGFEKTEVRLSQTLPGRFANLYVLYFSYNIK